MTQLLKEYYKIESAFYSKEVRAQYSDVREWSFALNNAQAKILEKMSKEELQYVLSRTQGPMRSVLSNYITQAENRGDGEDGTDDALATLAL